MCISVPQLGRSVLRGVGLSFTQLRHKLRVRSDVLSSPIRLASLDPLPQVGPCIVRAFPPSPRTVVRRAEMHPMARITWGSHAARAHPFNLRWIKLKGVWLDHLSAARKGLIPTIRFLIHEGFFLRYERSRCCSEASLRSLPHFSVLGWFGLQA